jgi:1-aminocyclopropane-1-carboxylate synthase
MSTTSTEKRSHRLSLQPPTGLPSIPSSPTTSLRSTSLPRGKATRPQIPFDLPTTETRDNSDDEDGEYTLIGCLAGLSISSLPPLDGNDKGGPVISRFPHPAAAAPSSVLGTRAEQRRIYLGPKLSDRATGGPDAGPLIERFSCLFKDRKSQRSLLTEGQTIKVVWTDVLQSITARLIPKGSYLWALLRTFSWRKNVSRYVLVISSWSGS